MKKTFSYKVKRKIAVVSETGSMTLEVNLISYCGAPAKYDLRRWRTTDTGREMQKGLTMTTEELCNLRDVLNSMDLDL